MSSRTQKTCMDAALGYLTARMRSEWEMRGYLSRRGYDPDAIEDTLARLCALGYIDDGAMAAEYVRARTATRPTGRHALQRKLEQKGIGKQHIEHSLSAYTFADEQEACDTMFCSLARKHALDRAGLAKIQRALLYRGFDFDMIHHSQQRFAGEEDGC